MKISKFIQITVCIIVSNLSFSSSLLAQVVPDRTLGTENSTINSIDELRSRIEGGTIRGENLFHSFEKFSIREGLEVYFANPENISSIFSRVTGNNISEIFGTLGVEGAANLFLINPNGIVFGENATVNINGSFIATTAEKVEFEDGTIFLSRQNDEEPILTYRSPIKLGLEETSGSITVKGLGNQIVLDSTFSPIKFRQEPSGLTTNQNQALALIGNGINFDSGVAKSDGGNIYLFSIESGSAELDWSKNSLALINSAFTQYSNINLNKQSLVYVSGEKGNIFLSGKDIDIADGSFILNQNVNNLSNSFINIRASQTLTLSDNSPDDRIFSTVRSEVLENGETEGADINISADNLVVRDFSKIQTASFSNNFGGVGGNLDIAVSNSARLNNGIIASSTAGQANSGNINFITSQLQLINESTLSSVVSNSAMGNGGKITINAKDIQLVIEETELEPFISSSTLSNSEENAGNAGNLIINTSRLEIEKGGVIATSSLGNGNAGDIFLNASESVEINGADNEFESTIRSSVQPASPSGRKILGTPEFPAGDSGKIAINTPTLNVNQYGFISAENLGIGNAGTINIATNSVSLKTGGKINASALSGAGGEITLNSDRLSFNNGMISASANEEGGNISLDASDLSITNSSINAESLSQTGGNINIKSDRLQLFDSNLSASAGKSGNGGNITITADTVLGINSDITATAIKGDGGNISITADGLLGFEERPADPDNGTSDLDASSEFGTDGTITIINPQINTRDPLVDLAKLEPDLRENNLENRCDNKLLERKQIIYTGRSNLSSNLSSEDTYLPTPGFVPPQETVKEEDEEDFPIWQEGDPIIDSNAVRIDEGGELYFVASLSPQKARNLLCQSTTTNSQSD